eukprot:3783759-Pyramimonas_sp.AAC.1
MRSSILCVDVAIANISRRQLYTWIDAHQGIAYTAAEQTPMAQEHRPISSNTRRGITRGGADNRPP